MRASELHLRLRDLGPGHAHRGRGPRRGTGAGQRPAARPTSAAACLPVEMVLEGLRVSLTRGSARSGLQTMPVDDYLSPSDARPYWDGAERLVHAVSQGGHRRRVDDMLPVLTGVRIEIDGPTISRWRPTGPAQPRRARLEPSYLDTSGPPWCRPRGARRHREALTAGGDVTIALSATGTGEGIIGFEGQRPAAYDAPRPGCSTASSSRSAAACSWPSTTTAEGRQGRPDRLGQARRPRGRAQHRGAAAFADGQPTSTPARDEAQASEPLHAEIDGDDLTTGHPPQFLLGIARRHRPGGRACLHPGLPVDERLGRRLRRARSSHPLPPHAASAALLRDGASA